MLPSTATTIGPRGSREGVVPANAPRQAHADPEVVARPAQARRRQFTAAYKLQILDEAAHTPFGQVGALLRREGLYSSHLVNWQRQRKQGALVALAPQRRGRPAHSAEARELAQVRAENARLVRALAAAELVIDVQKKVSALLGLTLPDVPARSDLAAPDRTTSAGPAGGTQTPPPSRAVARLTRALRRR